MNSIFNGPQLAYLIIALVVLGLACAGIVWVGRIVRGELGSDGSRGSEGSTPGLGGHPSPALMKEAIARGLVVPSQLAGMSNEERTFLFASLKQKLAAPAETPQGSAAPAETSQGSATPAETPRGPAAPAERATPALPVATELPPDVPAALRAMLSAEKLRIWCPMCGTELQLPSFPPLLARCASCGMKSAVRSEEGGRYTLIVSPPPKSG